MVSSSARVTSVKSAQGVLVSEFETSEPIDRTQETTGSDKSVYNRYCFSIYQTTHARHQLPIGNLNLHLFHRHLQITASPSVWNMPKISGKMLFPLQFTGHTWSRSTRVKKTVSRVLFPPIMRILRTLGRIRDGNPSQGKGTSTDPLMFRHQLLPGLPHRYRHSTWSRKDDRCPKVLLSNVELDHPIISPELWTMWRAKEFVSYWRKISHTGQVYIKVLHNIIVHQSITHRASWT